MPPRVSLATRAEERDTPTGATGLAVVDDSGESIAQSTEDLLYQILLELRAIRLGMVFAGTSAAVTPSE